LPGPVEVEAVAVGEQGLGAGLAAGKVYFDLSTNSPALVRKIYAEFKKKGIHMLDAPVSGGPRGAESRRLALWVGGDEDIFKRYKPVLDAIGDQPYYVGPIGAGSVAKLVHNCAGYVIQTALAEVFTMGVKAGVEPIALWKAVRQGAGGRRRTFDGLADQFLPGKFEPPSFALRLAHKDVTLATALGREHKVPMKLANVTLEEMTEALNRGWAERDSRVAMLLQEERAGVEIKVTEEAIREALAIDKTPPR
jgi:3-hydroxyisobutyrate dehydrogenase-like beta-hydroxyacid dehydrogenase